MSTPRERQLEDALRELERAASALLAHELHPCAAPKFRDIDAQIGNARKVLGRFGVTATGQEISATNSGGTGLEQSPSGCGDGRGDSELTPGGAGDRRVSSNPIAKRGARKAFREFLNEMGRTGKNFRNGRYQQRTRSYGDYLYAQDREKFEVEFAEAMAGNYTARGFDRAKWVRP